MNNNQINLKAAIHNLHCLPAMPDIAQRLLLLNLESVDGERELLKLIEQDPQISAKLIGLSNTPLFGTAKNISSIQDAATRLGLTRVKSVTLGIAVMTVLIKPPMGKLDMQALWMHSLNISLALSVLSQAMPHNTRPSDDEIFLAGLLHDIGYMVLNHLDMARSDALHQRFANEPERPWQEIEQEQLELSHAALGAALAKHWDLPESIVAVICYHHHPDDKRALIGHPLVSMVHLAEKMLPEYGTHTHPTIEIAAEEWKKLGIDPALAESLQKKINAQLEASKAAGAFH